MNLSLDEEWVQFMNIQFQEKNVSLRPSNKTTQNYKKIVSSDSDKKDEIKYDLSKHTKSEYVGFTAVSSVSIACPGNINPILPGLSTTCGALSEACPSWSTPSVTYKPRSSVGILGCPLRGPTR
jgi:hypothetical protein